MSRHQQPPDCPREDETVLFALHALEPAQEADVARHVRGCAVCQATVREVEATFAEVGAAAALPPPPQLRQRLLAATAASGPPVATRLDSRRAARTARSSEPPTPRRGPRRLLVAVAAALVVLGIAGGGVVWAQLDHQRDAATSQAATGDGVLTTITRSTHAVLVDPSGHPLAAVVLDGPPRFYALDLATPSADRMWVLWGARGSASTALATVSAGRGGAPTTVPLGASGEYEAYLLTQEPAGPLPARHGELSASGPVLAPTGS